jgi:site-specific DNA-methyltransferase (adenine-specific)
MQVQDTDISKIKPYENNPRDNSEAIGEVAKSIKAYGFQQPIVVDKDGTIIVGHTRYEAAKSLGLKTIPVVWASNLNEQQVKGYRLADNKTNDYSVWDNKKLLKELQDIDEDIYTGFKESSIFEDVLDESDNSPVTENNKGVTYKIAFSTQNKEVFERIKEYAESELLLDV